MVLPTADAEAPADRYNIESYSACARDEDIHEFSSRAAIGVSAPEIALSDLDGCRVSSADLRGRYVVLDFGSIT